MQLGPIISRNFTHKGNKDVWSYTVKLDSIKDLKKETGGKLHLSVPIADIHNRTFSVYFKFGVKNIAHKSSLPAVADSSSTDDTTGQTAQNASSSTSAATAPATSQKQAQSEAPASNETQAQVKAADEPETPAVTSADLAKYKVKPQTKSYADIALVNYPILQTVLIFLLVDGAIVAVAIYLYKKERRN